MMIFVLSFYMYMYFVESWWNDASKSINHITSVCLCVYDFLKINFTNL